MKKPRHKLLSTLDNFLSSFIEEVQKPLPPAPGRGELLADPALLVGYAVDAASLLNTTVRVLQDVVVAQIWTRHQLLLMKAKDRVLIEEDFKDLISLVKETEKLLTHRQRHLKEQISLYKTLMARLNVSGSTQDA